MPYSAEAATAFREQDFQIFRNACPRNCYDTCSIKTFVKDGVVQFIEGAQESTFTQGGLCVKGYAYPRRVYSPDRIKYPMVQDGRRTGNWRRVSWDEAMDRIAGKILEIKEKDGSLLGLGLTKYSGNFGITNYGVEGMMSSLGYTTRFVGTPCWPAGIDAQNYDLGDMWCNDPEDMVKSRYVIIWGANPAWCSVHSMKYVNEAKRRGGQGRGHRPRLHPDRRQGRCLLAARSVQRRRAGTGHGAPHSRSGSGGQRFREQPRQGIRRIRRPTCAKTSL